MVSIATIVCCDNKSHRLKQPWMRVDNGVDSNNCVLLLLVVEQCEHALAHLSKACCSASAAKVDPGPTLFGCRVLPADCCVVGRSGLNRTEYRCCSLECRCCSRACCSSNCSVGLMKLSAATEMPPLALLAAAEVPLLALFAAGQRIDPSLLACCCCPPVLADGRAKEADGGRGA